MTMKRKRGNTIWMVGLTLSLLIMAGTGLAQEKLADNMQIYINYVKADKKLFVAENMQLTEGEAKAFWPVYERYQAELLLLRTRLIKLINDYGAAYEKMTDNTAKNLLEEYMTIETLRFNLNKTYLPEFRKAMTEAKVLRYYQIENKTNAALSYELAAAIPYIETGKR
jgi:hypothetical protein